MKMNKKKLIGIIIAAVLLLVLIGILAAAYISKNENAAKESASEGAEYVLTDEESAALDEKISQAIDAYVTDFAKEGSFTEIMSEEDKKTLGKEILSELSGDLSEEETALLQEMIEKLFSENGGLTITGSASFSKEAKAEIAASIKSAVVDTLKASGTEGSDAYKVLQESVEKIVSEKIKESDVSYSLTSADISNIKQSVISSLGNINGKDGRDGRDGTDGKDGDDGEDGADGKNGYTPVKGIDYFTSVEVTNITDSITKHLESYVDDKELAEAIGDQLIKDGSITVVNTHTPVKGKEYFTDEEIDAISTTIKNSIMDLVNQSEQEIRENIETGNDDISEMIGTAEKEENSNIYSNEKTYESGDVIVQNGKIYICSEDITEPEEFNEEHWKATDLVSIKQGRPALAKKEAIDDIVKKLEDGLTSMFSSSAYKNWLDSCAKFHAYSLNNTILIAMQGQKIPGFQGIIAGYNSWQKDFNRHVMKDQKAIKILAPTPYKKKMNQDMVDPVTGAVKLDDQGNPLKESVEVKMMAFKPVSVWDISQTDGEPLPTLGVDELRFSVENYQMYLDTLIKISPVPVEFQTITNGAKGYFSLAEQKIVVNQGMSEAQTIKTLVHEISHSLKDDRDNQRIDGLIDHNKASRNDKEIESESCAYIVCSHFGIADTSDYSFGYIGSYAAGKEMTELRACMDTIKTVSAKMIEDIETELKALSQNKEKNADICKEKPSVRENLIEKQRTVSKEHASIEKVFGQTLCKADTDIASEIA